MPVSVNSPGASVPRTLPFKKTQMQASPEGQESITPLEMYQGTPQQARHIFDRIYMKGGPKNPC